jgi:hypothetical protein
MDTTVEAEPRASRRRRAGAAEIERSQSATSIPIEEISRRAYELFLERGGGHGADIDDWLRAERELGGRVES